MCGTPDKLEELVDEINKNYEVSKMCPYGDGKSWRKLITNGYLNIIAKCIKTMAIKVAIVGLGFVGSAMQKSFELKSKEEKANVELFYYDKYKNGGIGSLESCFKGEIMFLCLPTKYNQKLGEYDKQNIYDVCDELEKNKYDGVVVIKSTVEPETTNNLTKKYKTLRFVHNPEFLTARTAFEDFHNQKHIVLGKSGNCSNNDMDKLVKFYNNLYPEAKISICSALESESMKIFCNCFYAVKVQFFTELYLLCKKNGCNYELVKDMMLKNNWINPMHTTVPGPDGEISYGGLCFPKDTNALFKYMEKQDTPHKVIENVIVERNEMRKDNDNCL
jgi:UDPglucose 6-dehydrogenase